MAEGVITNTTDLGDSRVRLDVEVPAAAVEREVEGAAAALARDMKAPGFRKGKLPTAVVLQRVGRETVVGEALRRGLPDWYEQAVRGAGLATVGDPSLDVGGLPEKGAALSFSIEIAVRPSASLGEYSGLEVGRREPEVGVAEIDTELERLRESLASLDTVDRAAAEGDFVVLDFVGSVDGEPFEGGEARGYLLEIGSGRAIAGFEQQLLGARAEERRELRVRLPDDIGLEQLKGKEALFETTVKEVKEKRLPELDDDFALEAGGFDSLEELREDVASRLTRAHRRVIEEEFREGVVDAAVASASIDLPEGLVHAKAHEMWEHVATRLKRQGIEPERYLESAGKTEEHIVADAQPEAERSLKREAVLAAVVGAERIEASDEEILAALRESAAASEREAPSEQELAQSLERAKSDGRDKALREDIAMRKAVDLLVERAKPIPLEQAKAREKLWTPGTKRPNEAEGESQRLWTPGS